jgi:hypothetical protein
MDTPIYVAGIAAFAALLGAGITAAVTHFNLRHGQSFQLRSEKAKFDREQAVKLKAESIKRLEDAHKLVSKIVREFSMDNLVIQWSAKPNPEAYDRQYLQAYSHMDELRAIAAIHEPDLSKDIEALRSQMSHFWGNFKNVLHLESEGKKVDHNTNCFNKACAATQEASEIGQRLKDTIVRLAEKRTGTVVS